MRLSPCTRGLLEGFVGKQLLHLRLHLAHALAERRFAGIARLYTRRGQPIAVHGGMEIVLKAIRGMFVQCSGHIRINPFRTVQRLMAFILLHPDSFPSRVAGHALHAPAARVPRDAGCAETACPCEQTGRPARRPAKRIPISGYGPGNPSSCCAVDDRTHPRACPVPR